MEQNNVLETIKECLMDYSGPIFVAGLMNISEDDYITKLSATIPKEELLIIDNKYPDWYSKVVKNGHERTNILFIDDFDKISTEEQKLFMDIICRQYFCSEKLPSNLKIIIASDEVCTIIPEIREVIQFIEI